MTDTPRTSQFWQQVILLMICWTLSSNSAQGSPSTGLYFTLSGTVYLPGDTILITDVGDSFPDADGDTGDPSLAGPSLVCVTTNINTACCRGSDGGNAGEWFFPNGTMVPRQSGNEFADFTRSGFTQQVRLNRRNGATSPTGVYSCRVPDMSGTEIIVTITLGQIPFSTSLTPTSLPTSSSITSSPPTSSHPTSPPLTSSTSPPPPASSPPISSLSSLSFSSTLASSFQTSTQTSSPPTSSLSSSSSSLPTTPSTTLLTSSLPMTTVSQAEHTDLVLWSSVGAAVLTTCVALGCVTVLCCGLCARRRKRRVSVSSKELADTEESYNIALNQSYKVVIPLSSDSAQHDDGYTDVSVQAKQTSPSPVQVGNVYLEGYTEILRKPPQDTQEGYVNAPSETVARDNEDYLTIPQFLQN